MRHIVICGLFRLYNFFPTVINGTIFAKINKEINTGFVLLFFLQFSSEIFLNARRIQRDITITVHVSSCKAPVIHVKFWRNLRFLDRFSKNTQIWNFMTIRPLGAGLFHAGGRTDRYDKASSRFSPLCECALKYLFLLPRPQSVTYCQLSRLMKTNDDHVYTSIAGTLFAGSPQSATRHPATCHVKQMSYWALYTQFTLLTLW